MERITDPEGMFLDPNLVLYLPLWKKDATEVMSEDMYGHLCTRYGALWRPNGHFFDGTNDRIALPDIGLGETLPLTIIVWVNATSSAAFHSAYGEGSSAGVSPTIELGKNDSNQAKLSLKNDAATVVGIDGTSDISEAWHMLSGVVATGTDKSILYVDTVEENKDTHPEGAWTINTASVGTLQRNAYVDYWVGLIGEVWLYSRALTPLEIQNNYLATKWRYQ